MEEFKGDRRTREYKEWKAKFEEKQEEESKGLGDTVEKFTEATGIKKIVKAVLGDDIYGVEIDGFEGYYITKEGDVYSTRSRWGNMKPKKCAIRLQNGYPSSSAYPTGDGKRSRTIYIHREIGKAFIPKPRDYSFDELTINHKNGNREDNSIDNLEWVTLKENIQHSFMELNGNRVPPEVVLDVFNQYYINKKSRKDITDMYSLKKHVVDEIITNGRHIHKDNINDIIVFFDENELEPSPKVSEKISSCGCDERKAKLNKLVTYKVVECLDEDEYSYLQGFFAKRRNNIGRVNKVSLKEIITIYNRVFNKKQQMTNCSSCVKGIITQLEKLINNY